MMGTNTRSAGDVAFDCLNGIFMLVICLVTLFPVWNIVVSSLNDGNDALTGGIYWWPRVFSLENYKVVLRDSEILHAFWISVAKTGLGTFIHVFFTAMVAYALSKNNLAGRKLYMAIGTITLFFHGGLIPTYLLIRDLGLLDHFLVYILPFMFSFYNLILFLAFFREIPEGLEEAATIDGANDLVIFIRIILPVSLPVLATIALFTGVQQWNDYFTGVIYINQSDLLPIQTVLFRIISGNGANEILNTAGLQLQVTPQSVKLATMVVATLPIVIVYPFLQRYFVKGLMIGSLKG